MRQQLIITFILILVFCVALFLKVAYFPRLYGHTAYYFISIFWICGVLIVIFLLNIIWCALSGTQTATTQDPGISWPNRRKTFRIIYPAFIRPKLVMEEADNQKLRNLEFPVVDLSQEGSCFINDGSLGAMEKFFGHIRLDNGDRIKISGRFIRQKNGQVSVRFNRPIDWSTLVEEQRRVMAHLKPVR